MLREVLPDLVLLAIFIAFLLGREARAAAVSRARLVSVVWHRSRRRAIGGGARRRRSQAPATAARDVRTPHLARSSRTRNVDECGALLPPRTRIARASWFRRLHLARRVAASRRLAGRLFEKATDLLGKQRALRISDENIQHEVERTTAPDIVLPRRALRRRLLRRLARRRAARRRRRRGRLAYSACVPRAGLVRAQLATRALRVFAVRPDGGHQSREVLDARARHFVARKVGAT